jgi:tRNA A-37 threonylcarbamoyl transferase component Bud32
VGKGRGFLGAGGFGRVIRCHVLDEEKALKMVVGEQHVVVAAMREFEAMQNAKGDCPDCVIQVFNCTSVIQLKGSVYMGGYTMALGEHVNVTSSKSKGVRKDVFKALQQLHNSGWCHGDARVANVVKVGSNYQWIDFMTAVRDTRKEQVEQDVLKLIRSIYARVQDISSPDVKLPTPVIKAVEAYSNQFQGADGDGLMSGVVDLCEEYLQKHLMRCAPPGSKFGS